MGKSIEFLNADQVLYDQIQDLKRLIEDLPAPKEAQPEERYLTVDQTAEFLDVTQNHVYELKKRIPYYNPGARLYFKRSDLIAYMEQHRKEPKSKSLIHQRR